MTSRSSAKLRTMKRLLTFCAIVGMAAFSPSFANSQTRGEATERFEKAELSFDFPGKWKAKDNSTEHSTHITLGPDDGAVQISVISQTAFAPKCDFPAAIEKITQGLIESTTEKIQAVSQQTSPVKTLVGKTEVEGSQLRGRFNNAPATGEVYSFRQGLRIVSLVYLRPNGNARGQSAWESIRSTLKVNPVVVVFGTTVESNEPADSTILNGRALHLGRPVYSSIAKRAHASGTVPVQVTIDESGEVIAAAALEGHPLLKGSAIAAARESKFSPTKLCGEPVRVTGVITYNFVTQ